jgi:hypothetical protein
MSKKELEEYLRREPFEPFRINTADGKHVDILEPHTAVATDTRIFVAFPDQSWTFIVLRHVTGLKSLQAA